MKMMRILVVAVLLTAALSACFRSPAPAVTPTPPSERLSASTASPPQPTPAGSPSFPQNNPSQGGAKPRMPGGLSAGEKGAPVVKVYLMEEDRVQDMDIEEYLAGVLAGEMRNDWPLEALKAQAIIARTFALRFIEEKGGSKHAGANLSTDVTETQAYDAAGVNDRVKDAIAQTRGMVIASNGELINAWFHAHSGGVTATAKEGLEYEGAEPPYIQSGKSVESDKAPKDDASWTVSIPESEMLAALSQMGVKADKITSVEIGDKGPSGRTVTLLVNGSPVSCPSLRLRVGPMRLKSCLLTDVAAKDGAVVFSGKGYGHGVGLSQWGAYAMAEEGRTASDIILAYFNDVYLSRMWE